MKQTNRKLFQFTVFSLFTCAAGDKYFLKTCLFAICISLFNPSLIVSAAEPPIPSFGSNSFLPLITLNNPETFPENGPPLPDSLIYQSLGQQQQQGRATSNGNSFPIQQQQRQQQQQFPQVSNIGIGGGLGFGSQSDSTGFIPSQQQFQPQQLQNSFQSNNINNNNGGFPQPLSFEGTNNLESTRPRNDVLLQQQPTNLGPLQVQTDASVGFQPSNSQVSNNNNNNNNNNIGGSFQQPQQQQQQQNPAQGNNNNNGFNPSFSNQYNNFQQQTNFPQDQQQQQQVQQQPFSNGFASSNNNNVFNNNIDDNFNNNNNNNNLGSFQPSQNQNQNFPQQQNQLQSTTFPSSNNVNANNNANTGFQQQANNLAFTSQQQPQQSSFNGLDNSNSEFPSNNNNQFQQNKGQQQSSGSGFQQSDNNFNNNNNNNNNNFQSQNGNSNGNFLGNSNQNPLFPQIGNTNGNNLNNNKNNNGGSSKQVTSDIPLVPSQTSNEISAIPQGVQQAQQNGVIDDNVVKGQYRVGLPDGRTQIVRYIALVTYKKENGGPSTSASTSSSQQIGFSNSVGSQSTPLGALGSSSNVVMRGVRPVFHNYRGPLHDDRTEPNSVYPGSNFSFGGRIPRKIKRRLKLAPPETTTTPKTKTTTT